MRPDIGEVIERRTLNDAIRYHAIHRWFAWRPVFIPDSGWAWLRPIYRQFSSKWHEDGRQTWVASYWLERPAQQMENQWCVIPSDDALSASLRSLQGEKT